MEIPASRLKTEMARILTEQGYVESYAVEPGRVGQTLRVTLKYTEDRKPVIEGMERVSRPGRRTYVGVRRGAQGAGRDGHHDRFDLPRRDDRPRRPPRRRRRRAGGEGLVAMSRIGRQPITLPEGVMVSVEPELVRVNGPKGELTQRVSAEMTVEKTDDEVTVSRPSDRGEHRALHGLTRSLIFNMVQGVTEGFEKRLEIQGVGYRAQLKGKNLELALGYSHPVPIAAPDGIEFEVPSPTEIVVRGISKQLVGEIAAQIRKKRPPEPYKGKGIRYKDEYVARKVGKRA